jgi:hypothetical protein
MSAVVHLSTDPHIALYPTALSHAACDAIVAAARARRMFEGRVGGRVDYRVRRSSIVEFEAKDLNAEGVALLRHALGAVPDAAPEQLERLQVQLYQASNHSSRSQRSSHRHSLCRVPGACAKSAGRANLSSPPLSEPPFFDVHLDIGMLPDRRLLRRRATLIYYLSTPDAGGETIFPFVGDDDGHLSKAAEQQQQDSLVAAAAAPEAELSSESDDGACVGASGADTLCAPAATPGSQLASLQRRCMDPSSLKVEPRKGATLLFHNLRADDRDTVEWRVMHGGCPVLHGEKWIAQVWVRDASQPQHVYTAEHLESISRSNNSRSIT